MIKPDQLDIVALIEKNPLTHVTQEYKTELITSIQKDKQLY